jgi:hypothetical protein
MLNSPLGGRRILSGALGSARQRAAAGGGFTPTDIAGCEFWLDFSDATTLFTDAGSTPVSSDGDMIYQVNDKTGNGNTFIQATEGYRPLYKTGIKNGNSISRYDGSDDGIVKNDYTNNVVKTMFVVARQNGTGSAYHYIFGGYGDWTYQTFKNSNTHMVWYINSGFREGIVSVPTETWIVGTWRLDTGNATSWVNGNQDITRDFSTSPTKIRFIGSHPAYKLNGDIAEMIGYTGALSDTDRQSVETYLNNKWAIY